ncbi:tRNA-dihydrouridine(20a/20b) synthase [NAD(P)+]-like protein [Apophysomyces ossiformis]|uniref:tRNA-dihydrouridine(20a/20b) synthase [NAD(P)+]-like protein n=1 Tax=Apophysomyces ossiformis TaxID=679940 RepID=A0A8H7BVV7_9FUNG|nr:tRNA-dihydrouridine(20a/20b) synthase [NAD(P)+]-like protein [Apophysomyces ossiformis]
MSIPTRYNVDLAYTPMILADVFKNSEFARECDFTTNERDDPVVVQFAANNGVDLAAAAELVAPYVGGIDINCGCPQRWAIQEKIGSHLMSDPETVRDMIRTVKARVDIPCSIKIRVHPNLKQTYEFVKRAESVGVDFLTVHGRTRYQKSTEPVNFDGIKLVKESVGVPVIANGSIFSLKDVEEMYEKTGVDGVMSARGLLQNPALFAGYESTPWECIEDYVRLALGYGTNTFIFHHHLMFMFEDIMSRAERKTFNTLSSIPAILDHLETHWGLDASRLV